MSQNVVNYSGNPTGPQLLDDYLAKQQENELSSNSGVQRPSYAVAGTLWVDTSTTPWILKIYDGTNDVNIGTINATTHEFISSNFANVVNLTTAQSVAGVKTFTDKPLVPTPSSTDNVSTVVNKQYVTNVVDTKAGLSANNTFTGNNTFSSAPKMSDVELYPQGSGTSVYIDFHYNNSSSDYTSRIIESSEGGLEVKSTKLEVPTPTEDNTTSKQADTVGARNTKLATYALKNNAFLDYANASTLTMADDTVSADGWLYVQSKTSSITFTISGFAMILGGNDSQIYKVSVGDTYKSSSWNLNDFKFIPEKS